MDVNHFCPECNINIFLFLYPGMWTTSTQSATFIILVFYFQGCKPFLPRVQHLSFSFPVSMDVNHFCPECSINIFYLCFQGCEPLLPRVQLTGGEAQGLEIKAYTHIQNCLATKFVHYPISYIIFLKLNKRTRFNCWLAKALQTKTPVSVIHVLYKIFKRIKCFLPTLLIPGLLMHVSLSLSSSSCCNYKRFHVRVCSMFIFGLKQFLWITWNEQILQNAWRALIKKNNKLKLCQSLHFKT